jgi:hypothetical protein
MAGVMGWEIFADRREDVYEHALVSGATHDVRPTLQLVRDPPRRRAVLAPPHRRGIERGLPHV